MMRALSIRSPGTTRATRATPSIIRPWRWCAAKKSVDELCPAPPADWLQPCRPPHRAHGGGRGRQPGQPRRQARGLGPVRTLIRRREIGGPVDRRLRPDRRGVAPGGPFPRRPLELEPYRFEWKTFTKFVIPGLDPGIHGTLRVDGRVKPGHDELR